MKQLKLITTLIAFIFLLQTNCFAAKTNGFSLNGDRGIWGSDTLSALSIDNKVVTGDFNGDEKCDIAAFYDHGASMSLFEWRGNGLSTITSTHWSVY